MAPRLRASRAAALCAVASLVGRCCGFDTALGGSANEQPTLTTLGAGVLELAQPWLTEFDADVRHATPALRLRPRIGARRRLGGGRVRATPSRGTRCFRLALTLFPQAVCMDGSPAGFYWQAGSDTSTFVVYMEGA